MSTTNGGPAPGINQPPPQLNVLAQYIKDLSFENPNAPQSLAPGAQPQLSIQINVGAKPITETDIEVSLKIEGKAENSAANNLMFQFDLDYCGVFRIQNVPQESLNPIVLIECPRLLFPFAREVIATTVRNGGYPGLLLDPVDFVGLYRQKMGELAPAGGAAPPQS